MRVNLKAFFILVIISFIALSGSVKAASSPKDITESNSNAEEILIGIVEDIQDAPSDWRFEDARVGRLKYFTYKVTNIVKTNHSIQEGDRIKVVYTDYYESSVQGQPPIGIQEKEVVKIYANSTVLGEDVFEPVNAGDSIEMRGIGISGVPVGYLLFIFMLLISIAIAVYMISKRKKQRGKN